MTNGTLFSVLRWLLALPVAAIAAFAVTLPVHLAALFLQFTFESGQNAITFDQGTFPLEIVERLGYSFFSAATLVYVAGRVVPGHKVKLACVLALLWAVVIVGLWTLILSGFELENLVFYSPGGWSYAIIAIGLGLAGLAAGVYSLYRRERRLTLPCAKVLN